MTTTRVFGFGALALLVLAGGLGKVWRYQERFGRTERTDLQPAISLFTGAGWTEVASSRDRTGEPYSWVALRRPGCPQTLTVSVLGRTAELVRLVELYHNGDVAYAQSGRIIEKPSALTSQLRAIPSLPGVGKSPDPGARLPLLALAPKSVLKDAGCAVPFTGT